MSTPAQLKALINEEVQKTLWESKNVKKVVLENRLRLVNEKLNLSEAEWVDKAKSWLKNKVWGAEQGAKDFARNNVMVNPEKVVDDPRQVMNLINKGLADARKSVASFKADALRSSQTINSLEDKVLEIFGKFFNLIDSIPANQRGLVEREVMKVVGGFYSALEDEKKRIEVYLSTLAQEVNAQGYNLGASANKMGSWAPVATPKVVGSRVVEPEEDDMAAELLGARG